MELIDKEYKNKVAEIKEECNNKIRNLSQKATNLYEEYKKEKEILEENALNEIKKGYLEIETINNKYKLKQIEIKETMESNIIKLKNFSQLAEKNPQNLNNEVNDLSIKIEELAKEFKLVQNFLIAEEEKETCLIIVKIKNLAEKTKEYINLRQQEVSLTINNLKDLLISEAQILRDDTEKEIKKMKKKYKKMKKKYNETIIKNQVNPEKKEETKK